MTLDADAHTATFTAPDGFVVESPMAAAGSGSAEPPSTGAAEPLRALRAPG